MTLSQFHRMHITQASGKAGLPVISINTAANRITRLDDTGSLPPGCSLATLHTAGAWDIPPVVAANLATVVVAYQPLPVAERPKAQRGGWRKGVKRGQRSKIILTD